MKKFEEMGQHGFDEQLDRIENSIENWPFIFTDKDKQMEWLHAELIDKLNGNIYFVAYRFDISIR